MSTYFGIGDRTVAQDLYQTAARCEIVAMRKEGVYVCIGNILSRMPAYNQEILNRVLWSMALTEGL